MITLKQKIALRALLTLAHADYAKGLNTRAFFKVHDKAIGEDIVQNTFLKTWSYMLKGGKVIVMKSFLYNILNNLIIDEYRKHKTTSLDVLVEKGFDAPIENQTERTFDIIDGKTAILLIARIPLIYQRVMILRYMKNLSIKEISDITGQTKNAVAVQAHRGLEILKTLYASQ